jgi:integrase
MVVRNKKYSTKHGRQAGKYKSRPKKSPLRPYAASTMWVAIDAACEKLGIPHWHPHQLRHLAATRLAAKYGVEVTQILLGHADAKTTLKYIDPTVLTKDDRDRYAVAIKAIIEHG